MIVKMLKAMKINNTRVSRTQHLGRGDEVDVDYALGKTLIKQGKAEQVGIIQFETPEEIEEPVITVVEPEVKIMTSDNGPG